MTNPRELESVVEENVVQAWQEFRNGNLAAAERVLGESPESDIFVVPPARAKSMRWWRIFVGASVVLMLPAMILPFWHPVWFSGLKPVNLTEAQVREFFSLVNTNPNPLIKQNIGGREVMTKKIFEWDPFYPLSCCLLLPETNLFTPRGLQVMRDTVAGGDFEKWSQSPQRVQQIFFNGSRYRALSEGWISWADLNLQPADCEAYLHTNRFPIYTRKDWDRFLSRGESWSWVKSERFQVMRIQAWGIAELRFIRAVNSLDLVDREKLIAQIASVQTLSGTPPGQPLIHDWRDVRGLFFTPCWPALQDTYFSLAALEILGGLDKIDREACIEGILKRHQGNGYFTSPDSGSYNEYHIDGSARDTIAAFESLRILGALGRVKDLDKWQFRVPSYRSSKPDANGVRTLTWDEIEAWVCQQRLQKILLARKEHPSAPVHSLLEAF